MKKWIIRWIIFQSILMFADIRMDAQKIRVRENFDDGWQFHKGDIAIKRAVKGGRQGGLTDADVKMVEGEEAVIAYTDRNKVAGYKASDWKDVDIPHDWLVEEPFVNDPTLGSQPGCNGYKPVGIGFYRKEFCIGKEDEGKKVTLEFDGIFRNSTVWVNGHLLGNHPSGYIPSFYDITDVLRYGEEGANVVLVKVDATDYEGWWYEGCGIYRHVWLTKTDCFHVARFGTFVTTPTPSVKGMQQVGIQTDLQNEYGHPLSYTLVSRITDSRGRTLCERRDTGRIEAFGKATVMQESVITDPQLWSPETPYLYRLYTELLMNGKPVDDYVTKFGVRHIELTTDGFFLNGKRYPIKGTANHQDFAGVGVALPDKINEYRIRLLKEMGSNGYRTAHHPPTPELLDICDSLGMLVMDENRMLSSSRDGLEDLATLVLRDRNHPSVFMWSLENEETLEGTRMGARILRTMHNWVKKLDPTRPTVAAMNHGWNEGGYSDVPDVVGYNYGQRGMQYVKDKERFPNRKMIASESTSFVSTRGEHEDNPQKGYMSNFGKGVSWGLQPGEDWKHIVDYPYLSGTFVWTGFDYRGEPTPYWWPCINSHFGIMDMCGFPKDGYYAYKAAWTDMPVVHVYPHWNLDGKEGEKIRMGVYTNCDEVELRVNGRSIGRKQAMPYLRLEFEAVYRPGRVEAIGYRNGKVVAEDIVETTGEAKSITLAGDCQELKADGRDVWIVNVALRDKKGRVVPTADNLIKFEVDGPARIIGVGNGNPSSHEPDKANQRKAFNGYCQVLIQTEKNAGEIRLSAFSDGLKEARLTITSK